MCSRYELKAAADEIARIFELLGPVLREGPEEVFPSYRGLVVRRAADGRREALEAGWGFLPFFVDPTSANRRKCFNARSETVATNGMFRRAFASQRCLVPFDTFYEWSGEKGAKVKHALRAPDGSLLAFAGLWEESHGTPTFTVLTTRPNGLLTPIHDRMPVILPPETWTRWLSPDASREDLEALLAPAREGMLVADPPAPVGLSFGTPRPDDEPDNG